MLSVLGLLSGCGGGAPNAGMLNAAVADATLSVTTLTLPSTFVGSLSQATSVTLSNTGTAVLSIASITASANFTETNNCFSDLAAEAQCTINVACMPSTTGMLNGTVVVTDNASSSPQTISVTCAGVAQGSVCSQSGQACGNTPDSPPCCSGLGLACVAGAGSPVCEVPTLTGACEGSVSVGFRMTKCVSGSDPGECPVGQQATNPTYTYFCDGSPASLVDADRACHTISGGISFSGQCLAQ